MEFVKDKVMYHINSSNSRNLYPPLKAGKVFTVGDTYNPYRGCYEEGYAVLKDNTQSLLGAVTLYWHFTVESVFEEIRQEMNEKLPSRHKCLWLCDESSLNYWKKEAKNDGFQTVKLKLNGKLHKCDGGLIEGNPIPLKQVRENARDYWSGKIYNNNKVEYLFEGKAEVIKVT